MAPRAAWHPSKLRWGHEAAPRKFEDRAKTGRSAILSYTEHARNDFATQPIPRFGRKQGPLKFQGRTDEAQLDSLLHRRGVLHGLHQ